MKTLENLIDDVLEQNRCDFRFRAHRNQHGQITIYVHPIDISGDTLDFAVSGNTLTPIMQIPCDRCAGCGKLADDEDQTPWKYWMELPVQSAIVVLTGIVKPIDCPNCKGLGYTLIEG